MKKTKCLLFMIVSCMIFASCGAAPSDVSPEHYTYAQKALEIVDAYLDYNISIEDACDKISELKEREDTLPDTEYGDPTHAKDFSVETDVLLISSNLLWLKIETSPEQLSEVLASRNNLAELIGAKTRE